MWFDVFVLLTASYTTQVQTKAQKQLLLQHYETEMQKNKALVLYERRSQVVGAVRHSHVSWVAYGRIAICDWWANIFCDHPNINIYT